MPDSYEIEVTVRSKDSEQVVHGEMKSEAPDVKAAAEAVQSALKNRLSDYTPIDGER